VSILEVAEAAEEVTKNLVPASKLAVALNKAGKREPFEIETPYLSPGRDEVRLNTRSKFLLEPTASSAD